MVHGFFSVLLPIVIALPTIATALYSCRAFTLLKESAKSNDNIFDIDFKSDNFRERAIKKETDTTKDAKMIKKDNFTRSNREKSNIEIAILKIGMIGWHQNYFVFWW